jgi:hypothetical protein
LTAVRLEHGGGAAHTAGTSPAMALNEQRPRPDRLAASSRNGVARAHFRRRARTRVPRRYFSSIALDRDNVKGGVFAANIRLERTHFRKERLDRLHIGELNESYTLGRRGTVQANDVRVITVEGVGEVLAAAFFYVG